MMTSRRLFSSSYCPALNIPYDILKEHIAYIHLKNGKMEDDIVYTAISDGAVNIDGVIRRSTHNQYKGWYTLEPHCSQEEIEQWLIRDMQYVKEIMK